MIAFVVYDHYGVKPYFIGVCLPSAHAIALWLPAWWRVAVPDGFCVIRMPQTFYGLRISINEGRAFFKGGFIKGS
jgi:hypothetical protein